MLVSKISIYLPIIRCYDMLLCSVEVADFVRIPIPLIIMPNYIFINNTSK